MSPAVAGGGTGGASAPPIVLGTGLRSFTAHPSLLGGGVLPRPQNPCGRRSLPKAAATGEGAERPCGCGEGLLSSSFQLKGQAPGAASVSQACSLL